MHLAVDYVSTRRRVAHPLVVKSWKQQMSGVIGNHGRPVEAPRRSCKDPMLGARRCGLSDPPVPEQKADDVLGLIKSITHSQNINELGRQCYGSQSALGYPSGTAPNSITVQVLGYMHTFLQEIKC
ncbi:hypothetical protein EYF80_017054 [Liparis tanakae]|uniref:Uncharacterized protein n=1 Tax=Liparis tanakae TaxID=230148 RepID=A0A4Z2I4M3_9TELE|nr:hypothetical protein EYF80_017054 [Liparis tanakae]